MAARVAGPAGSSGGAGQPLPIPSFAHAYLSAGSQWSCSYTRVRSPAESFIPRTRASRASAATVGTTPVSAWFQVQVVVIPASVSRRDPL